MQEVYDKRELSTFSSCESYKPVCAGDLIVQSCLYPNLQFYVFDFRVEARACLDLRAQLHYGQRKKATSEGTPSWKEPDLADPV